MNTINSLFSTVTASALALVALFCFWAAYQIAFHRRVSLIRLGSKPLPGAALLATSFARVFFLQGIVASIAAIVMPFHTFGNMTANIVILGTIPGLIWRAILINSIERYAKNALNQAAPTEPSKTTT